MESRSVPPARRRRRAGPRLVLPRRAGRPAGHAAPGTTRRSARRAPWRCWGTGRAHCVLRLLGAGVLAVGAGRPHPGLSRAHRRLGQRAPAGPARRYAVALGVVLGAGMLASLGQRALTGSLLPSVLLAVAVVPATVWLGNRYDDALRADLRGSDQARTDPVTAGLSTRRPRPAPAAGVRPARPRRRGRVRRPARRPAGQRQRPVPSSCAPWRPAPRAAQRRSAGGRAAGPGRR